MACLLISVSSASVLIYLHLCSFVRLKNQVSHLYKSCKIAVLCVHHSWLCWFFFVNTYTYRPTGFLCYISDFNACDDFQLWRLITHMLRSSCKDVELVSISNYVLVDFFYY
jgi:hypothetical protein